MSRVADVEQHSTDGLYGERNRAWASEGVSSAADVQRGAQMDTVFGYIRGFHATHVIHVGATQGLFKTLAARPGGMHPTDLAQTLGMHAAYVRTWCETACSLDLLDYDPASGYRCAPHMDQLLGNPDSTYYVGGFPEVHLQVARDYPHYPARMRTGEVQPYWEHDEPFLEAVAQGLKTLPRMFVDAVLPKLPKLVERLEGGAAVLDVGCGGGYALVELARRFPGVRCVGIDVDETSLRMARALIQEHGLQDRVEVRHVEGDRWPADLDGQFDLVTTFLVLHEIEPRLKAGVLAQAARALKPGGQVLIFDERYPSRPAELRDPSKLFVVVAQWFEMTWGNVMNTREEIHALLREQGLRVADEASLSRFYIVTAEKPGQI